MRNKEGATPKQEAARIAATWIKNVVTGHTADLDGETPAFMRETRKHLAKMHDDLLSRNGFDFIALSDR